jgi:alcohol dehydrogenase, propanol-preferring
VKSPSKPLGNGLAMSKRMKAAILRRLRKPLKIETIARPEPGIGEILVGVVACGVCHSDLHAVDGDWTPGPVLPLIPGHEVTGHVVALGSGVEDFKIGDPVGIPWMFSACRVCEFCLAGQETICPKGEATGYTKPGGYAEFIAAPAEFVGRLPKDSDLFALAPVLCAGVTTYRGLKRCELRPGQWVTVLGVGGLGHIAIQYARAMGLRVAAVDLEDAKLRLARRLGAEVVANATKLDVPATIRKHIGGSHGAIVTAASPKAFEQAVELLRPGGTCIYIGIPGGRHERIRNSIAALVGRELTVRGSNVGSRLDLAEAIGFATNGLIRPKIERQPLARANQVLDRMRKGRILGRVVLQIE